VQGGEEDWVHTGEAVPVVDGLLARLCMSVDPVTGVRDGPYVVIGSSELTLAETTSLGASLLALAGAVPSVATDP
jgi:hypothetical protein